MSQEIIEAIELLEGLETALILEYGEAVVDCQYGDLRQALTKLKEAPEPTESIKEVIAILEKEIYFRGGDWKRSRGVEKAIAKLRSIEAPKPTEFTKKNSVTKVRII